MTDYTRFYEMGIEAAMGSVDVDVECPANLTYEERAAWQEGYQAAKEECGDEH